MDIQFYSDNCEERSFGDPYLDPDEQVYRSCACCSVEAPPKATANYGDDAWVCSTRCAAQLDALANEQNER